MCNSDDYNYSNNLIQWYEIFNLQSLTSKTKTDQYFQQYSDWVCTAVMSNDVMKDLRG